MKMLSTKEFETLTPSEKKEYLKQLNEYCRTYRNNQPTFGQKVIKSVYPHLRNYTLIVEGTENVPKDSNVIFVANHSNSHDIFTAYEMLSLLSRRGSVMVASDCLNPITVGIFNTANATLFDRRDKEQSQNSVIEMSKKIIDGNDGLLFGEATWNLHPYHLMHNIKPGAARISSITGVPIIPTIFEYIEEEGIFNSESKLFKKCIIRFGKPIMIDLNQSLIEQTNYIKKCEEDLRQGIWNDYSIKRESLDDIDPETYLNHTYVKKFKAFGFKYDSAKEQEFLYFNDSENKENEYRLSEDNKLVPGITEEHEKKIK